MCIIVMRQWKKNKTLKQDCLFLNYVPRTLLEGIKRKLMLCMTEVFWYKIVGWSFWIPVVASCSDLGLNQQGALLKCMHTFIHKHALVVLFMPVGTVHGKTHSWIQTCLCMADGSLFWLDGEVRSPIEEIQREEGSRDQISQINQVSWADGAKRLYPFALPFSPSS